MALIIEELNEKMTTNMRGRYRNPKVNSVMMSRAEFFFKYPFVAIFVYISSRAPNLLTTEIGLASDKYPEEAQRIELFSSLTEELRAIPGVTDVAVINQLPIRDPGNNIAVYAADRPAPALL